MAYKGFERRFHTGYSGSMSNGEVTLPFEGHNAATSRANSKRVVDEYLASQALEPEDDDVLIGEDDDEQLSDEGEAS